METIKQITEKLLIQYKDLNQFDKDKSVLLSDYDAVTINLVRAELKKMYKKARKLRIQEAVVVIHQKYKDIESFDRNRESINAEYRDLPPTSLRDAFRSLLEKEKKEIERKQAKVDIAILQKINSKYARKKVSKSFAARTSSIMKPKSGNRVTNPNADKIKTESTTTKRSIHTLRG